MRGDGPWHCRQIALFCTGSLVAPLCGSWQSLQLTRSLGELVGTGWPVLVSMSRKDFVGETLNIPVEERLPGTLAATAVAAWLGVRVFRAHDVTATRQLLDMVAAIRGSMPPRAARRGLA